MFKRKRFTRFLKTFMSCLILTFLFSLNAKATSMYEIDNMDADTSMYINTQSGQWEHIHGYSGLRSDYEIHYCYGSGPASSEAEYAWGFRDGRIIQTMSYLRVYLNNVKFTDRMAMYKTYELDGLPTYFKFFGAINQDTAYPGWNVLQDYHGGNYVWGSNLPFMLTLAPGEYAGENTGADGVQLYLP